jgi:DNA-directed RNA polymerase I subunit RPA1
MSSRTKKWNGQFAQIVGASFGFLSDEDITRISVKKIDVPRSFDTLLHPVSGGLYDPALGPFDKGVMYEWLWNFF